MTKQRALVLSILQDSDRHLNAEQIFGLARKRQPSIVRATIYNNLHALTEQGLIRRVKVYGSPDCYDSTLSPHDHLVCDGCGKFSDVSFGDLLQEFQKRCAVPLTGYELSLHYLCPACQKAQAVQKGGGNKKE